MSSESYDKRAVEEAEAAILEGSEDASGEDDGEGSPSEGPGRAGTDNGGGPADLERRKLVIHLRRYAESALNKHLGAFDLSLATLNGLSYDQLNSLIDDVQLTVSMRSSNTFHSEAFYGVVGLAEPFVSQVTPYNVNGMSQVLRHDPAVDDILLELSLQSNRYISPEARLCMACVKAAMVTNTINQRKAALTASVDKEVGKATEEKYSDL